MAFKRLIEVAFPVREISAESVRDKSLRHGHISTLHLWWARRPLPAARGIVFASLVPDPDDPQCPTAFKKLVSKHLKDSVPKALQFTASGKYRIPDPDPYRPYENMPDTLRNRLLMFIAKWSRTALDFETGKTNKQPKPAEMLDDRSLIKWETSDPANNQGREVLRIARELIAAANDGSTPTVLDPFAGGGAIPLEAGRLGCQPIANDYNPVAYLILRASCEWPQKYGKPGTRPALGRNDSGIHPKELFDESAQKIEVKNVLAYDVERWAKAILESAREKIGEFYPPGKDGHPVVGYFWARTAPCGNPSCRATMPLLRSLLVCDKPDKKVALEMRVNRKSKTVEFGVVSGKKIEQSEGTIISRGGVRCPFCEQISPMDYLREAGSVGKMSECMVVVITDTADGKAYRAVEKSDLKAFDGAASHPLVAHAPKELIPADQWNIKTWLYGMKTWGSLFNPRQLVAMQTFLRCFEEIKSALAKDNDDPDYTAAVCGYLGLWISRTSMFLTNVGLWKPGGEFIASPFSRQAIPMVWDYPEVNPFADASGGAIGQLEWMTRFIEHESALMTPTPSAQVFRGDGAKLPVTKGSVDVTVTDPPYFDAIAYADLSDFFYVWLKRSLGSIFPEVLSTPLTPKTEEATALKHRHGGSVEKAENHFEAKLAQCLAETRRVTKPDGVIAVMFAHQSVKAWTALIQALFNAGLSIDATWAIDTERDVRAIAINSSALASSITVICRPRVAGSASSLKDVKKEINAIVAESVKRFWDYGFRGADLIVACYGPAVGVFGKYDRVEKADGTLVEVSDLLELARDAARDAIAGEFRGDNLSTLYYVWANLYGINEQSYDDAILISKIGDGSESAIELAKNHDLFVVDGSACRLALLTDRQKRKNLGIRSGETPIPLVDALHRAMLLWKQEKRGELVQYLSEGDFADSTPFWKLAQALFEVLPRDGEDWRLINALLVERSTLQTEVKRKGRKEATLFDK
ncbi:MAG: DUF1156 domain-containing protein [Verrucomicrobia bacterium]|nr:DUF1156 domain-containing protein [Verrucomicrobiota bacterium]